MVFSQYRPASVLWASLALCLFSFFLGQYECRMRDVNPNIAVRQKFNEQLSPRDTPLIRVTPVTRTVACEVGKEVILTCSVQAPYVVQFTNISEAGRSDI